MTQSLSHNFIIALDAKRDLLYTHALAAANANPTAANISPSALQARAEVILQSAIREAFAQYEKDHVIDPITEVEKKLAASSPIENQNSKIENDFMPADIWARLVAAVQVEAARSTHSRAINPDSVLLSPDPLLAPKKNTAADDAFDLSPPSRFFLSGAIAIFIAVALTIYLLTRPMNAPPTSTTKSAPPTAPSTTPAQ